MPRPAGGPIRDKCGKGGRNEKSGGGRTGYTDGVGGGGESEYISKKEQEGGTQTLTLTLTLTSTWTHGGLHTPGFLVSKEEFLVSTEEQTFEGVRAASRTWYHRHNHNRAHT